MSGYRLAPTTVIPPVTGFVPIQRDIVDFSESAGYAVLVADSSSLFVTNTSSTLSIANLPDTVGDGSVDGVVYEFFNAPGSSGTIEINADAGDTIQFAALTGTQLQSATPGDRIDLECINNIWVASNVVGAWALV